MNQLGFWIKGLLEMFVEYREGLERNQTTSFVTHDLDLV